MGAGGLSPIVQKYIVDGQEAGPEIRELIQLHLEMNSALEKQEEQIKALTKQVEDLVDETEDYEKSAPRAYGAAAASAAVLAGALSEVLEYQKEIDERTQARATGAQATERLIHSLEFGAGEETMADQLRRFLESQGEDEGTLRGLLDPIQEFIVEAETATDPAARKAAQDRLDIISGSGFDLELIAQGGPVGIASLMNTMAAMTPEQMQILPAAGISIGDVQRMAPLAQTWQMAGGWAGLQNLYGGYEYDSQDLDKAALEALELSGAEARKEYMKDVKAGKEGSLFGQIMYSFLGGTAGVVDATLGDVPVLSAVSDAYGSLIDPENWVDHSRNPLLGGSPVWTPPSQGAGRDIFINVDGNSLEAQANAWEAGGEQAN